MINAKLHSPPFTKDELTEDYERFVRAGGAARNGIKAAPG